MLLLPSLLQRLLLRSSYVLLCTIVACVVVRTASPCACPVFLPTAMHTPAPCQAEACKPALPKLSTVPPSTLQPFFNAIVGLVGAITYWPRESWYSLLCLLCLSVQYSTGA